MAVAAAGRRDLAGRAPLPVKTGRRGGLLSSNAAQFGCGQPRGARRGAASWLLVAGAIALGLTLPARAQEEDAGPQFSASGLIFGDLYGIAEFHDADGQGAGGAVVRRIYLTGDVTFDDRWSARVRIEVNQSGDFEVYDYEADFKDVWVRYRSRRQTFTFGKSATPTFDLIEDLWGLRYLMRTPMDLQGLPSRETGLAARGPINASGSISYRAMAATGVGLDFDSDGQGTRWMGALSWRPASAWVVDAYADYEFLPGLTDRVTLQGFVGYQTDAIRFGAQYSRQTRQLDPTLELVSGFAVAPVLEDTSVIVRVDRLLKPSVRGDGIAYIPFDPSSPATMLLSGLEFEASPFLRLTPNFVFIAYDRNDEGYKPPSDLHLRVTLYLDIG